MVSEALGVGVVLLLFVLNMQTYIWGNLHLQMLFVWHHMTLGHRHVCGMCVRHVIYSSTLPLNGEVHSMYIHPHLSSADSAFSVWVGMHCQNTSSEERQETGSQNTSSECVLFEISQMKRLRNIKLQRQTIRNYNTRKYSLLYSILYIQLTINMWLVIHWMVSNIHDGAVCLLQLCACMYNDVRNWMLLCIRTYILVMDPISPLTMTLS